MIEDFDEFSLYVYVIIDEICQQMSSLLKRPGPTPECSDSELIAMILISECKGWDVETELLSNWRSHRDLFPTIPSQSRFNRRRRNLMFIINCLRRILLSWIEVAQDNQCVIDSLPIRWSIFIWSLLQQVIGVLTKQDLARCHPKKRRSSAISSTC